MGNAKRNFCTEISLTCLKPILNHTSITKSHQDMYKCVVGPSSQFACLSTLSTFSLTGTGSNDCLTAQRVEWEIILMPVSCALQFAPFQLTESFLWVLLFVIPCLNLFNRTKKTKQTQMSYKTNIATDVMLTGELDDR